MHDEKHESPRGRRLLLQVGLICGLGGILFGVVMSRLMSRRSCARHAPCQRFVRSTVPIPPVPPVPPTPPLPRAFHPLANARQCQPPRATTGRLRRVLFDSSPAFSPRPTRIDFERTPDGAPLHPGDDVEHAYGALGLALSTSIGTSYVGANSYVVDGRSRGNSAATVRPVWEGTMTLRFHRPGDPGTPASVRGFGLWIAHVFPDGTRLQALDSDGEVVGEIEARCQGSDFLGFESEVPIAAVRVVPNPAIDPNYTVDDLVFPTPVAN